MPTAGVLGAITVSPPLDASEVAFLAGFAAAAVRDHAGRPGPASATVRRVWPGQPRTACPWTPCAQGCCLLPAPRKASGAASGAGSGAGSGPGVAAQWMRFLVGTFLRARHRVDGALVVPVHGRPPEVVLVEDGEVFEGLVDPAPDDPVGGWTA